MAEIGLVNHMLKKTNLKRMPVIALVLLMGVSAESLAGNVFPDRLNGQGDRQCFHCHLIPWELRRPRRQGLKDCLSPYRHE